MTSKTENPAPPLPRNSESLISLIIILGQEFHSLGLAFAFFLSHCISMAYFICVNYFFEENEV